MWRRILPLRLLTNCRTSEWWSKIFLLGSWSDSVVNTKCLRSRTSWTENLLYLVQKAPEKSGRVDPSFKINNDSNVNRSNPIMNGPTGHWCQWYFPFLPWPHPYVFLIVTGIKHTFICNTKNSSSTIHTLWSVNNLLCLFFLLQWLAQFVIDIGLLATQYWWTIQYNSDDFFGTFFSQYR